MPGGWLTSLVGSFIEVSFMSLGEANDACRSDQQTVGGKWRQRSSLEVLHEEANRQVGSDCTNQESDNDLAVDGRASRSGKARQFESVWVPRMSSGQFTPPTGIHESDRRRHRAVVAVQVRDR